MSGAHGVLFDIGGVIVTEAPDMTQVTIALGLDATESTLTRVRRAFWSARDAYDLGLSDQEYWALVAEDLGVQKVRRADLEMLIDADVDPWRRPRADVVALIQDIAATGTKVGILSNAPRPLARSFVSLPWIRILTATVFSCDSGAAKPDPRSYEAAIAAMEVPADALTFFDDRIENVEAALTAGVSAYLWTGVDDARDHLPVLGAPTESDPNLTSRTVQSTRPVRHSNDMTKPTEGER